MKCFMEGLQAPGPVFGHLARIITPADWTKAEVASKHLELQRLSLAGS